MQTTRGVAGWRSREHLATEAPTTRRASSGVPDRGAPAAGWLRWVRRHPDALAVLVLALVPVVWFGAPAVAGHPAMPGDDILQNFPLRVLVGQQLRHGTLPTYDPYIWGGAPLLGGWNAGAFYPFTFLFAVLPGALAWTLNLFIVYWVAVLGLYALLRRIGRGVVASALAGASFGFAGAMDVHVSHFGLVAGMSWTPLIILAMRTLARAPDGAGRLRWTLALGCFGAMVVLAGEPRSIATVVVIAGLYGLWLLWREARPLVPFVVSVGVGLGIAVLVSAVQWLPGSEAVSTSQRAVNSYILYSSGSLAPRWLTLGLVPTLLGGTGSFGTAPWFTSYNLPEVMGYAGLLPLTAAVGLLGTLRRRRPLPEWLIWHVVAVVGVVLALGSFTPLGHVLVHVPMFGGQRLQSRNIAITDLALAILVAYFVDLVLDRARAGRAAPATAGNGAPPATATTNGSSVPPGVGGNGTATASATANGARPTAANGATRDLGPVSGSRVRSARWRGAVAAAVIVPVAAAVLSIIGIASPSTVAGVAGATVGEATRAAPQRPLFVVSAVLALALAGLLLQRRLSPRRLAVLVVAFVVADLALFNVTSVWDVAVGWGRAPATATATSGVSMVPLHLPQALGTAGRFVMYNPNVPSVDLMAVGEPDLNVLDHTYSAQGYSSIVDGTYAAVTGSHLATGEGTNTLDPASLVDGVFDSLDTTALLTYPTALVTSGTAAPAGTGDRRAVGPGVTTRWVFAEQLDLSSVSVRWSGGVAPSTAGLEVWLEQAGGALVAVHPAVSAAGGVLDLRFASPAPGVALVLGSTTSLELESAPVLRTAGGGSYVADGPLEAVLSGSHWRFAGDGGPLAYFANTRADPPLSLRPAPGDGATAGASVRALSGPVLVPGSARVSSARGVRVVRAVAEIPGWSATWRPSTGGRAVTLPVQRLGLVQAVDVPAGDGVLSWHYSAPGLATGAWCTLAGGALALAIVGALGVARRRRRAHARPRRERARRPVPIA